MRRNTAGVVIAILFTLSASSEAQLFTKITEGVEVSTSRGSRSVAWIDADFDGDLDLFISTTDGKSEMFRNEGDGTFSTWSAGDLVAASHPSDGATWGDFDNDGLLDVFIANWGEDNLLFKGNGDGTWSLQGSSPVSTDGGYSESGAWGDMDLDGDLDLYVANSEGDNVNFLYRNDEGALVRDESHVLVTSSDARSRSVSWIDWSGDGRLDLHVGNEGPNHNDPFQQLGDGSFVLVDTSRLAMRNQNTMSTSWGDIDNDGDLDLFVANLYDEPNRLWENMGNGYFVLRTDNTFSSDAGYSFSSSFGDFDNDGDLDLFVSNGFAENNLTKRTNFFYENDGAGVFTARSDDGVTTDQGWSYGASWADYDGDGDLDLYVAKWYRNSEANAFYRNESASASWVQFDLEGTTSNRTAISTIVRVKATIDGTPTWQMRVVEGQNAYCSQNLRLHFGLGDAPVIDSLVIDWYGGEREVYESVTPGLIYKLVEGGGMLGREETQRGSLPSRFELGQAWPNPFNGSTRISYELERAGEVNLAVHDLLGRRVVELASGVRTAGQHEITWRPQASLSSGVYLVSLRSQEGMASRRLVYLK